MYHPHPNTIGFTADFRTFISLENQLTEDVTIMGEYYHRKHLVMNISKCNVTAFHLANKNANQELDVVISGTRIPYSNAPKYLGVTFDRSLTYKQQCLNTAAKIRTRNSLIAKVANTRWDSDEATLRITANALCVSVADYCCPVWANSAHAEKVDIALNQTMRHVSGCIRATNTEMLSPLAGMLPHRERR